MTELFHISEVLVFILNYTEYISRLYGAMWCRVYGTLCMLPLCMLRYVYVLYIIWRGEVADLLVYCDVNAVSDDVGSEDCTSVPDARD